MYICDLPDHTSKLMKQSFLSLQIKGRTYLTLIADRFFIETNKKPRNQDNIVQRHLPSVPSHWIKTRAAQHHINYPTYDTQEKSFATNRTKTSLHFTVSDSLLADDRGSFDRAEAIMSVIFHLFFLTSLAAKSFSGQTVFILYIIFQFFQQQWLNLLSYQLQNFSKNTRHFIN